MVLEYRQSTGVRSISLAPGYTYKVSCSIGNDGVFVSSPWAVGSNNLPEMAFADASGTGPLAFYEDIHTTTKNLYLYNFDSSLTGNYTCSSTEDTKSLVIKSSRYCPMFCSCSISLCVSGCVCVCVCVCVCR